MADTVAEVAALVQFIVDDRDAQFMELATQLPAIRSGYREFQRRSVLRDLPYMKASADLSVGANVTLLDATSTPALPDDFNFPLVLHEKQATGTDFFPNHLMIEATELPDIPQDTYLRYWTFQSGQINLLGATSPLSVRVMYSRVLPDLDNEDAEIAVPLAVDSIAYLTVLQVGLARGVSEKYRARVSNMAEATLDLLTAIHVKRDQYQRRHRPPHAAGRF